VRTARTDGSSRFRAYLPSGGGERSYVECALGLVRGHADTAGQVLVRMRDITQEVETLSFFQTMAQRLPVPLSVRDAHSGRYLFFNHAAERLHGIAADDAVGHRPEEVLPRAPADAIAAGDREFLESGASHARDEETMPGEDGENYFVIHRTLTFDDGGPRHIITLREDVTRQRRDAAQLQAALTDAEAASRARSAFLANMSHELRTPLNGMIGSADLLQRRLQSQEDRELAQIVMTSGRDVERLLGGVLDLASIDAGRLTLEPSAFSPETLAREALETIRGAAQAKGVDLALEFVPEAYDLRLGDSGRIGQVLGALLDNAVKFTDRGSIRLSVSAAATLLRFAVHDTGIGFDETARDIMFARLRQVDESHARRHGGAGLGLAVGSELCALMGSSLQCESSPGAGACFWFDLDLPPAPPAGEAAPVADLRVLAADDHPANRRLLELMLDPLVRLTLVGDGLEALTAMQDAPYDVVLMDMQMPRMDGLEATAAIRRFERESGRPRTPVIMVSANTRPEHVKAGLDAGADSYLCKPVTADGLLSAMACVLQTPPVAVPRPQR
jgi:PAS domain S-box-containing protein